MIADEIPPHLQDDPSVPQLEAANDNDAAQALQISANFLAIARAIGRQIAHEELASLKAANDNNPKGAP